MNGTEINGNSNGNGKAVAFPFFSRLFNIAPSEWPRVTECWLITFFFKAGSAVGWTVLTAAFVSRFGIKFLPLLFVMNALLIMGSTFLFEQLILRIKREVLMILMILLGALCIFFASFLYDRSSVPFFALVIFAESVFLAQFNVFIPILVGDRFTPLESQSTFPFVESGDTIGGMLGGALVGFFAIKLSVALLLYVWIGFLACVIFVFVITSVIRVKLPPLPFRVVEKSELRTRDQIAVVMQGIKQIPFLKGLVIIVMLQWIFFNILDFQYTKAIEQSVTQKKEPTIALIDSRLLRASILSTPPVEAAVAKQSESAPARALTPAEQNKLAQLLGTWKGFFHLGAFLVQILFASRFITSLGIVGSLLLHPIIMLISLVGMFLKFGFLAAVTTRMSFEVTNVVHKNAYFSSHYALPQYIRDQAAQFLEGMVRPMGTVVGMIILLGLQFFLSGRELSMWIHVIMFTIMVIILFSTIRLQSKYTKISRDQLFSSLPYPEKLNAIEILAQRGHKKASFILAQKLTNSTADEVPAVRIKIISVLGKLRDYETLPEILDAFSDPHSEVRLYAAHALMNFRDIGERFYSQAFSRYRMVETLKEVFSREQSAAVRSAIIRVFSLLRQPDVVPFLLGLLQTDDAHLRGDVIYTLGLFRDPNTAYYIAPYLRDADPWVRANAVVALWNSPKYNGDLVKSLEVMLEADDVSIKKAGLFALGEVGISQKQTAVEHLNNGDETLKIEAAFALTKCADARGFSYLLDHFLRLPVQEFETLRRFFHRLKPNAKKMIEQVLTHVISRELEQLMEKSHKSLHEINPATLEKLRRLYELLDQHEELFAIEEALKVKSNM